MADFKVTELADDIDFSQLPYWDVVIIGAGPAGLAAGLTTAHRGLTTLIVEAKGKPGGQPQFLYADKRIVDIPGFPDSDCRESFRRISNAGLEFLLKLSLQSLSLNPLIDDMGLKTLSRHETLRHLAIWDAKVTSWEPLTRLDRLQVLLVDDSVPDLSGLQRLRQLEVLLLWGDRFSPTELARLRLALPNCQLRTFARNKPAHHAFRNLVRVG